MDSLNQFWILCPFSGLIKFKGIDSICIGNTNCSWHAVIKQLFKLLLADAYNQITIEGKASDDQIFDAIEQFCGNI